MPEIDLPDQCAQAVLGILVEAIQSGRIQEGDPRSFLTYSEVLQRLGLPVQRWAGRQLQGAGLDSQGCPGIA